MTTHALGHVLVEREPLVVGYASLGMGSPSNIYGLLHPLCLRYIVQLLALTSPWPVVRGHLEPAALPLRDDDPLAVRRRVWLDAIGLAKGPSGSIVYFYNNTARKKLNKITNLQVSICA